MCVWRRSLWLIVLGFISVGCLCAQDEPVLHESKVNPRKGRIYENGKDVPFTGIAWKSYSSGKVKERVHFVNGVRSGKDIWYYENGKVKSEADKKYRKTFGVMTGYREDGTLEYKKTYVDGFLHGLETIYFRGGKIESSCNYKFDKPDGKRIIYFPDGKVRKQESLSFGKRSGEFVEYYDSGKLKERSHYKYDKLNGHYECFFPNGNLYISGSYDLGKRHGEFTEYYENGKVREKTRWEHGRKLPELESFHANGKINIRVTVLKDGQIRSELYDESGKLVSNKIFEPRKMETSATDPLRIIIPREEQASFARDFRIISIYGFSVNRLGCTPELRNHPLFYYLCRKLCGCISVFNQTRCIEDAVAMAEKDDSDVIALIFVFKVRSRQWKSSEWISRAKKCLKKVPPGSFYEYHLSTILQRFAPKEVSGTDLSRICLKFAANNVLSRSESEYLCTELIYLLSHYGDFPEAQSMIKAIRPENLWMKKTLLGQNHITKAWDARGNGWASTVSDEGWKGFFSNLKAAKKCLTEAWKMSPDLPEPACLMITVSKGDGEVPDRIRWFNRAVAAQADCFNAYNSLKSGLLPRWGGSIELMMKFGDACFDSGLYQQDVVMRMLWMYKWAATEVDDYRWQLVYMKPETLEKIDECLEEWCVERYRSKSGKDNYYAAVTIYNFYAGNFEVAVKRFKEQGIKKFARCKKFFYQRQNRFFNVWVDPVEALTHLSGPHGNQIIKAIRLFLLGRSGDAIKDLEMLLADKKLNKSERSYIADLWGRYTVRVPAYRYLYFRNSLFAAWKLNKSDLITKLLELGINPDVSNSYGNSLLHLAARRKDTSLARQLIKAGADVDFRNNRDMTPLMQAINYNKPDSVKLLVESGADVNAFAKAKRMRVWDYAMKINNPEITACLKDHGAK